MNSIFKKPSTSSKRGRNGFDLSFRRLFTAQCGMMLPVAFDYCQPGDKYRLNASVFARTEAVETAAFTRFKLHVDWHYVPMRQLYAFWNEFYNQVFDGHTNFVKSSDNFALPTYNFCGSQGVVNNFENIPYFAQTFTSGDVKYVATFVDGFFTPKIHNFRRLFDLFGYGALSRMDDTVMQNLNVPLTPYLAYHKIFYSHYNNSQWFANDPSYYNVDSLHGQQLTNAQAAPIISTIHYAPWRNDYFHNILPSPTFSSKFANSLFPLSDKMSSVNKEQTSNQNYLFSGTFGNGSSTYLRQIDETIPSLISTSDIRSLFALDRLTRVTGLAGSHYDEQIAAHFGVKLNKILANESQFIGSQTVDMSISEVVATASTGQKGVGGTIGDIAGKGFANGSGKNLSFTANEHGVIMAIFYIEPLLDYSSQGINPKLRYKDSLDFYHPELDDIGMQPFDANTISVRNLNAPQIAGWQYRYSELKTNWDVVNEGFYSTDKRSWQTNFQHGQVSSYFDSLNTFNHFYISPQYTNDIFALKVQFYVPSTAGTIIPWGQDHPESSTYVYTPVTSESAGHGWDNPFNRTQNVYQYDNFLISADFKIFKTSIMSVHSLPRL